MICPVCVAIPVFKISLSDDELLSIKQTIKVLRDYDIALVCPHSLDVSIYKRICSSLIEKRFPDFYFKDINGYNRLLLSSLFYQEFQNYRYILICQPDAYVFRDELIKWCDKNYDYIGAPIIGNYTDCEFSTKMRVGNGGFSLRNVQTILHFFNSRKNVFSPKQASKRISLWKKPQTRIFIWILMLFGWRNKPLTVASNWEYNEDDFWSGLLDDSRFALKKPNPVEALDFSFERFPSDLFKLSGNKLPFGCHAWRKYEYDSFWKQYISHN